MDFLTKSTLICPKCDFAVVLEMPTNSCLFFYQCENCKTILKPLPGDCCVFCSFGNVKCPSVQQNNNCCSSD
ncbi:MAG TPA: GDCCVxC domain-containing (seleno)protein [Ignavibacteria bacterium]|nr:GDCCVxC domain-containing (seleno)protein [Ignavibacteria bacterium]